MNIWVIIALITAGVIVFAIIVRAIIAAIVMKNVKNVQKKMFEDFDKF